MNVDANRIRCIDPLVSPQYPFDEAYDASCDFYRDACFHGGIGTNFTTHWTQFVMKACGTRRRTQYTKAGANLRVS